MAANGGIMVLQNGSPRNTYKELWDKDVTGKGRLDTHDKLIVSFDGRAAGGHPDGMPGAVGEVFSALELSQYNNARPVRPYEMGDAQKYANKLKAQVSKQRLQSNYRMSLATRPMFKDLQNTHGLKSGLPY